MSRTSNNVPNQQQQPKIYLIRLDFPCNLLSSVQLLPSPIFPSRRGLLACYRRHASIFTPQSCNGRQKLSGWRSELPIPVENKDERDWETEFWNFVNGGEYTEKDVETWWSLRHFDLSNREETSEWLLMSKSQGKVGKEVSASSEFEAQATRPGFLLITGIFTRPRYHCV